MNRRSRACLLGTVMMHLLGACSPSKAKKVAPTQGGEALPTSTVATGAPSSPPKADWQMTAPEICKGMAYVPGGALVAGSSPGSLPRRPDRELPGEQVMLKGFWIDKFAFPNEEGAIPLTSVTQPEAQTLCEKAGKRLCTELEWERACKGPNNHRFAWGNEYRADACQLGAVILPRPSGMKIGCHSDFGVYDLHGGILEWTMSDWRRGTTTGQVVVKGGNSIDGALVGRCANAEPYVPVHHSGDIGFRCCKGPINTAEVVIQARNHDAIEPLERTDRAQFQRLLDALPASLRPAPTTASFTVERGFLWHPVNNETLTVYVACYWEQATRHCGTLVGRDAPGQSLGLGYADTGVIPSALHMDSRAEDIWLLGLDGLGNFKRLVRYRAGEIVLGPKERRIPTPKKHGTKHRK